MDLKDIKAIIDLMKKNSISEFELEEKDSKLRLKRGGLASGGAVAQSSDEYPMPSPVVVAPPIALPATSVSPVIPVIASTGEVDVKSPMIGTFYRSPSPEAAPYVDVGTEIGLESVVCIIEAMKVMNEIKGEVKGVVTQILVENGKPVEFGQPLFKVRPI